MNGPDPVSAGTQPVPDAERRALREAAETFESLLVRMMLRAMRRAQLEDGLFGKGTGSDVYEGMFDQHMSESLAVGSPFGIARALEERWTRDPATAPTPFALREAAARAAAEYDATNRSKSAKTSHFEGDFPVPAPQVMPVASDENNQEPAPIVKEPSVRLRAREGSK